MNNNRGLAPVCSKQGMALVVALLTSFILLALVASLFWVIASTSRQVEYAKNSAIALNLAEAGTADAIYRLNYCGTDGIGNYPFDLTTSINPFIISNLPISTSPLPTELPLPSTVSPTASYASYGLKADLNNGYYVVGLLHDTTGPDTLVAVGIYKGVRRILTIPLRGNNALIPRQGPTSTQGISEAFNKHVIYAGTVVYTLGTINGNITSTNADALGAITTTTGVTRTKVANIDNTYFPVFTFSASPVLPVPSWTHTYNDGNCITDGGGATIGTEGYGNYAGGTYNVNSTTVDQNLYFQTFSGTPPTVNINTLTINSSIGSDGTLSLTGTKTIGTGVFFQSSVAITVSSNTTIIGDLIVKGVPLTLDNPNIRINGAVLCDNAITLSTNASIINASTSIKEAAILMDSPAGATITISTSPTITLGPSQKAAVIAYSNGGAVFVTVNGNLTPTPPLSPGQAGIVAYAGPVNDATVNIGNSATANVNGLIYAYSSGPINFGNITLGPNASTINGALVADGTVTLNGGILTTLTYDPSVFIGASASTDIFPGFSGGRRAYVPTWQGWRLK